MKSHRKDWKEKEVQEITELLKKYEVFAIGNLNQFPNNLLQIVRKKLHGKAVLKVSKKKIIELAIKNSGRNFPEINEYLKGSPLLIFTNENPFELYSVIKKSKGKLFANEGSVSLKDIVIPEGDTGLAPGPVLTDLKNAGLNVRPQGATIHVVKETIVAKAGEAIKAAVANVLKKLNIKALELSLPLKIAYDNKIKYTSEIMDIDTNAIAEKFSLAHSKAMNLALNSYYPTKHTTPLMIQKLARDSFAVALESNYLNKKTAPIILGKAQKIAEHLKDLLK